MPRRWLPILLAAMLAAGCGSSSGSDKASSAGTTATSATTATATTPTTATTPSVEGANLRSLPRAPDASGTPPRATAGRPDAFLRGVFDDVEALWQREFRGAGLTYHPTRLTIFSRQVQSGCGTHGADVGPFYCPASFGVYLDPTFFTALSRKVGVNLGGVAQAYVVAHEVAHHVQTLLRITHQKAAADQQDPAGANARSVRFELQADCLAGVWMHSVYRRGDLTSEDVAQALDAAAVVGDDFQRNAAGETRPPEEWTHGSSAQRQRWLTTGLEEGTPGSCDTFNT